MGTVHWICCDRISRAACAQSFAPRQQATIEIMRRNLSLRTLVVTFNRSHVHISRATTSQSLLLLLARSTHTYFCLHAHLVRGESHNQRNTTEEVATTSPPFCNEPHRSRLLCVKAERGTTFTPWSQHHFVAIGNPERHMRKASHRGSKQQ